eukprot:jgi/Mesen1/8253/ME000445S07407
MEASGDLNVIQAEVDAAREGHEVAVVKGRLTEEAQARLQEQIDAVASGKGKPSRGQLSKLAIGAAQEATRACKAEESTVGVGKRGCQQCKASPKELAAYLAYPVRGDCPDDWPLVERLAFDKSCFYLPRRRCFAQGPANASEPSPFPRSTFDQKNLMSQNVRWEHYTCPSFACLERPDVALEEVIEMKKGSIRIGLDVGGSTGTFAAFMSRFNVTIMTTSRNFAKQAVFPYLPTIALRGLIPLHLPHRARLPLFDNTLDIVHSQSSIDGQSLDDFEALVFDWNRVLRPGGLIWFDLFSAPSEDMPGYNEIVDALGYKRLYWNISPSFEDAEQTGPHLLLNAVLEKPPREA